MEILRSAREPVRVRENLLPYSILAQHMRSIQELLRKIERAPAPVDLVIIRNKAKPRSDGRIDFGAELSVSIPVREEK